MSKSITMTSSTPSTTPSTTPRRLPIALTIGDPNGVGPETALAAATLAAHSPRTPPLLLIGPRAIWQRAAHLLSLPCPPSIPSPETLPPRLPLAIWNPAPPPTPRFLPGHIRTDAARTAFHALTTAANAALAHRLAAIVTSPISKEGFQRARLPGPGHTEILAAFAKTNRYAMMLFGPRIRVALVTRHLPLARVPAAITQPLIETTITLLAQTLPCLGFPHPRIGVCGLNPHAGDGGTLGQEDLRIIRPAITRCRRAGIHAEGPFPADSLFYLHYTGAYDAVVAMYHDQGLAPLKMLSFSTGVNLTLGLPFIRTSPDHGTAFPIAWKHQANPASTRAALACAIRLARQPHPWPSNPNPNPPIEISRKNAHSSLHSHAKSKITRLVGLDSTRQQ